jgi:uncharacterized protein YdaU (DUF1376 family)
MAQADPAFLFYSRDFYEGTRMMHPEERACYIDLMIYQHQHGYIPIDTRRIMLYCGGVSEAVLIAVLEAKFKRCEQGWYNERLQKVIEDREDYKDKQSKNGKIGQFYKKSKALLSASNYRKLCQVVDNIGINDVICRINVKEMDKAMLEALLEALLKHLEDANAIEDINNDIEEREEEKERQEGKEVGEQTKFQIFNHWLKTNYPNVSRLSQQMTEENLNTLIEKYGREKLSTALDQMENYKKLNDRYLSVYRTAITFIKNIK